MQATASASINQLNCKPLQIHGILDSFRLIAALLVIAIHTSPLSFWNGEVDFFLTRVLARIAVPFFLMITGQFVVAGFPEKSPLPYLKKIALLYGFSILLYLPLGIYAGHYENLTLWGILRMLLFDGTFYHLWYFPACILGIFLLWLMKRFLKTKGIFVLSALLYLLGLFGDSYFGLIENVPILSDLYSGFFNVFSYTRNGLFLAPMFLLLGAYAAPCCQNSAHANANSKAPGLYALGFLLSFALMTGEAFTLHHFGLQRHDSMYLALLPTMFFLYRLLLLKNQKGLPLLRSVSTWVYLLHPAMIVVVRGLAKILHATGLLVDNGLVHYLAVALLSLGVSFPISLVWRRLGHKISWPQKSVVQPKNLSSSTHDRTRAWIELDMNALEQNVNFLKSRLPKDCVLMPAVKANAYGHGAVLIAKKLNQLGINAFCAASAREGVTLRKKGITGEILVLGYTHPDDFPLLCRYQLTQTVVDYPYALLLNQYDKKLPVHIGVDTGMHRLGERCENVEQICSIYEMPNLLIQGMFTHLSADDSTTPADKAFTKSQAACLHQLSDELIGRGYPCPPLHLLASYGVLNYPELSGSHARVGIALYGVLSTKKDSDAWADKLHPVLSLKARVASVRSMYQGETAGYGTAFISEKDRTIATIAIGYADGLPRSLSNGVGSVLIRGQKAPILGLICMDQTIVDVSHISNVSAGDIAIIIGTSKDEQITAADLADSAGTITNEILSRLGSRLERIPLP